MDRGDLLGNNRIEDVRWLCSLSESELDLLISLKMLVLQRAKVIGHDSLANKFDLKTLRALGFILMEHLKGQIKDLSVVPGLSDFSTRIDGCNLVKANIHGSFRNMSSEELMASIGSDKRKRMAEMLSEEMAPSQKKKPDTC